MQEVVYSINNNHNSHEKNITVGTNKVDGHQINMTCTQPSSEMSRDTPTRSVHTHTHTRNKMTLFLWQFADNEQANSINKTNKEQKKKQTNKTNKRIITRVDQDHDVFDWKPLGNSRFQKNGKKKKGRQTTECMKTAKNCPISRKWMKTNRHGDKETMITSFIPTDPKSQCWFNPSRIQTQSESHPLQNKQY